MPAPEKIKRLIEVFERNLPAYKSPGYKEANLRSEFIEPFFEELGWDVRNKQGWAEAYKDVITEDAIKVGGYTKAPDYCFRIGGARKFFLEAKKPSVDIKEGVDPAYQLRRYAWSADLPLSILTDFEEFAVYNCRVRPQHKDKSGKDRVMYLTYKEYAEKWDEIAAVFSRKAVMEGLFDKYAESVIGRRTTQEVDTEFLKEIETWRTLLAKSIAIRNPSLTIRELNYAVEKTIDRIIFLRICEDRGIEQYGQLQALLNGQNIYKRLAEIYQKADEKYNSGLFHFREEKEMVTPPDTLTPKIKIDDQALKEILANLYYPESPYEFSVLGVDILGNIYEQFLGKVIRLTAGHHAVIEEKPEVRKAGGVYYTPTYIVDYIVKNTVGKLCEEKSPKQIEKLKILDPACGSGSFLIGAYTYLLNYHRDWYVKHLLPQRGFEGDISKAALRKSVPGVAGGKPEMPIYQGRGGQWYLSTQEKKRILLNNIHGVDIDSQAVEVTKLSLLLKVLENENQDTLDRQMKLWRERALPDLGNNIKCGNSLIGPDIYEMDLAAALSLRGAERRLPLSLRGVPEGRRSNPISFTPADHEKINAFDWNAEFSGIFTTKNTKGTKDNAGFDVVIGNPPYIRMESFKEIKTYLRSKYACHDERSDLYAYFVEKAHLLLRPGGRFGMILSNKFLRANYGRPLRAFLSKFGQVENVTDFAGLPVFSGATVRTVVLVTSREGGARRPAVYSPPLPVALFKSVESGSMSVGDAVASFAYAIEQGMLGEDGWSFMRRESQALMTKLAMKGHRLAEYCNGQICMGIKSGLTEAFVIDSSTRARILARNHVAEEIIKPFLNGRDVRRYHIEPKDAFLIYTYHGVPIERYPEVARHLEPFKPRLRMRATKQEWYELQQPQHNFSGFMDGPKIIFPDIATMPHFALDEKGYYCSNTTYFIPLVDLYILGLLNSRLGFFYFSSECAGLEGKDETYLRFFGQYLEGFPVRTVDFSDPSDKARHDRMVALVEQMLELNKELAKAKTPDEKTRLERQIKATDDQIDRLVYELYGLTEEEIGIVEEGAK